MATQVRKVANKRPVFETAVTAMNHAIVNRVSSMGAGHRKTPHPIAGDLAAILRLTKVQKATQDEAKSHGLRFNDHGILVLALPASPPLPVVTPSRPRAQSDVSMRSAPVPHRWSLRDPYRLQKGKFGKRRRCYRRPGPSHRPYDVEGCWRGSSTCG